MIAQRERILTRSPHRQLLAVEVDDIDVGFQRVVLHPLKTESIFENVIRCGEPFLHIASAKPEVITNVASVESFWDAVSGAAQFRARHAALVNLYGAGRRRFFDVE